MTRFTSSMKSKVTILIIASVLGLFCLSAIQAYLINNTYELRKDAFMEQTNEAVTVVDDHLTRIDSMRSEWRDTLIEIIAGNRQGYVTKDSILYYFQLKTDSLQTDFIATFKEELEQAGFNPSMKFQKKVLSIIVLDTDGSDTIYSSANNSSNYILGEDFDGEGYKLSGSTSYSEYSFDNVVDGKQIEDMVRVNFETETRINIEGWESEVLGQMKGLLFISISIFLFVFGLLYYSIKNLITQKKIAEVKTDFINNISHEFKTPLATLALATGILKEGINNNESAETITIIDRQNKRLQKLLEQVLDNSLTHNEIRLNKKDVMAEEFIASVLNDFTLSSQDKDIELTTNLKLDNRIISIDPFYLTTALLNMLDNAVKYNAGKIELNFSATIGETILITLEDNGIGVSVNDQKNLFEKFYRVGNKNVHEIKGLGLGLFYTDQIVKTHGGTIKLESKEGKGSTFIIELPIN